jgi:chemotaxis signal transduction protein
MKVVVFRLGRDAYAVDVERVWDTATRLGLTRDGEPTALVVVDGAARVALVVDDVLGVRELADDSLRPLPRWSEALGVAAAGDELVVVLDADRLLGRAADDLEALPKRELQRLARGAGIPGRSRMNREQLLAALRRR